MHKVMHMVIIDAKGIHNWRRLERKSRRAWFHISVDGFDFVGQYPQRGKYGVGDGVYTGHLLYSGRFYTSRQKSNGLGRPEDHVVSGNPDRAG